MGGSTKLFYKHRSSSGQTQILFPSLGIRYLNSCQRQQIPFVIFRVWKEVFSSQSIVERPQKHPLCPTMPSPLPKTYDQSPNSPRPKSHTRFWKRALGYPSRLNPCDTMVKVAGISLSCPTETPLRRRILISGTMLREEIEKQTEGWKNSTLG